METQFITDDIFNFEPLDKKRFKTKQIIGRHVSWLRNSDRPLIAKIGIVALIALECLALTLTVIGIYFIHRGVCEHIKLKRVEEFNKMDKPAPPNISDIPLISRTSTFNHTNFYVIHEGLIWTKIIHENDSEWTPIYFDGTDPVEIKADGANLIVRDSKNRVHYKKVIREWRDKGDDRYCYADKSTKNNWKDKWFSLPVFNFIANIFTGKLLQLPENTRGWAISHRSAYNNYQTDAIGQKHVEPVGTTQLYALESDGKWISVYDPWIHTSAKIHIPVPNTANSSFEAIDIAASASTVMLIGYELTKTTDGRIKRELKVYIRFVDVDVLGWNPGVKYDYPGNNPTHKARVIPMPGYQEHPFDFEGQAGITGKIRIIQNGQGNEARILLAEGKNSDGESGYYRKKVDADQWQFVKNTHNIEGLLREEEIADGDLETFVGDYSGEVDGVTVKVEQYGEGSYLSKLHLSKGNDKVELVLHRRKTLMTLLGFNVHKHEIALPKDVPEGMKATLNKFFGNKKVIKASIVTQRDNTLKIKAVRFICPTLVPIG